MKDQMTKFKCQIQPKLQMSNLILNFDIPLNFDFWHSNFFLLQAGVQNIPQAIPEEVKAQY